MIGITPENRDWWFTRGQQDSLKGKGSLFRQKRGQLIQGDSETPEDWTELETHLRGEAYLEGYHEVTRSCIFTPIHG